MIPPGKDVPARSDAVSSELRITGCDGPTCWEVPSVLEHRPLRNTCTQRQDRSRRNTVRDRTVSKKCRIHAVENSQITIFQVSLDDTIFPLKHAETQFSNQPGRRNIASSGTYKLRHTIRRDKIGWHGSRGVDSHLRDVNLAVEVYRSR